MKPMMTSGDERLILAFINDILFASKVEAVAEKLGYQIQWIERAEQVASPDPETPERQLAEHLEGPGGVLLEKITSAQPALLIFDLNNQEVPWEHWMAIIKSAPAARRIPILAYGSHVDVATMDRARTAGADKVFPRSRFARSLPDIIEKYARIPNFKGIEKACQDNLSPLAIKGLIEFNRGEYFESHEDLEDAWNEDNTEARELYRAILQVAVAYLQIERGNYKGAMKMFLRVRQWIDPLPDVCRGVDIAKLRTDAYRVHEILTDLGPERIHEIDQDLLKPVLYTLPDRS